MPIATPVYCWKPWGLDITPTGAHYLLNHFDVPLLADEDHRLSFTGAFDSPYTLSMDDIRSMPEITMSVTMECAGKRPCRLVAPLLLHALDVRGGWAPRDGPGHRLGR